MMFNGIISAAITPLTPEGRFDPPSFNRLLDHMLAAQIEGLFVLGAAGECAALPSRTRRHVVEHARERLGRRAPLIVGVFGDSTELVLNNIRDYATASADYVLTTPPNSLPLTQADLIRFFRQVADASPVPIVMYNCPINKNQLNPETVAELAEHPQLVGLKDTSTAVNLLRNRIAVGPRDDFKLISGHEYLFLTALGMGIDTFIVGGPGNMFPAEVRRVRELYQAGAHDAAREQFLRQVAFMDRLYNLPCGAMAAIKGVLTVLGLTGPQMASPAGSVEKEDLAFIRALMTESGLFTAIEIVARVSD